MAGLEDLYREIILDHYRSPRNRGELAVPPAHRVEGFNPLCGDEVVVFLEVEDGKVADLRIAGQGCSISQSSASMMSAAVKGQPVGAARMLIRSFKAMMSIHEQSLGGDEDGEGPAGGQDAVEVVSPEDLGELAALQGVVKFPVRIKCATLSWNALSQGLDEIAAGVPSVG
jgi:nitrogen fixation NifU-like protein